VPAILGAVIGFFAMATVALLAAGIWGHDWSMFGALLFLLGLPLALLALLPLPDFRWESVTAAALGMPVGFLIAFETEDAGTKGLWIAAVLCAGASRPRAA
jgi:hypothetical protein